MAREERLDELVRGPLAGPGSGLSYVVWEITLACDLACRHCGSRAGRARPDELDTEAALRVVDELAEMGVDEVTLIGGEAYLRPDWDRIARAIVDAGMTCTMTTGGRGLDDAQLERAVRAGLGAISVSIDGLREAHDAQRVAKGSFDAAVAAASRIAASPIQLAVNTQINRVSMPDLVGVADLLARLNARSWQVQLTVPMGRAADRPGLLLQPYDLLELFPLLAWIKRERLDPRDIDFFPGNNIGYFSHFEEQLRFGGGGGTHWGGCGAGQGCLGIEADGSVKPCPSLPTERYRAGYTPREPLAALVESEVIRHLGERTRDDLWGYCASCDYAAICRAGCTWTAEVTLGRPGNNPYCIHRQLDFESRGLRERLVRVEAASGEPFDHGRFELRIEPMPEPLPHDDGGGVSSLLGVPLAEVVGATADDASRVPHEARKHRLRVVPSA